MGATSCEWPNTPPAIVRGYAFHCKERVMKKILLGLALVALTAPLAVQATESNGIGYTYVQMDYVNMSQSGHGFVADGGSLSGSYGFASHAMNFHVFGSYTDLRSDNNLVTGFDDVRLHVKERPWTLGVGLANSIGSRADWVTQVSYTHDRYDLRLCWDSGCVRGKDKSNIGAVTTGVQGRVTDKLTANAYVGYSNGDEYVDGSVFGDFGMVYSFNKTWAAHGGIRLNNDSTQTYALGVRASF